MQSSGFIPGQYTRAVRSITLLAFVFWTLTLVISLAWNVYQLSLIQVETARVMARTAFQRDLLYRHWASKYGRVIIPVTGKAQTNSNQDGSTAPNETAQDGKDSTLINLGNMTREVFDLQDDTFNVFGHITSLNPLREENAADAWEMSALLAFEKGSPEASTVLMIDGKPTLRLMLPLKVEPSCMVCHASQGYKVGEIRGGISETVHLMSLDAVGRPQQTLILSVHGGIWFVGLAGIFFFSRSLKRSTQRWQEAEEKLLHMSNRDSLTGLFNRRYFEDAFNHIEDAKVKPVAFLNADLDNLKRVNDTLGHAAGDILIQGAAEVLKASFRMDDVVARVGGDEFVVILYGGKPDNVDEAVDRIRQNEMRWNDANPGYALSLSIGTALSSHHASPKEALTAADEHMYADKATRKSRRASDRSLD